MSHPVTTSWPWHTDLNTNRGKDIYIIFKNHMNIEDIRKQKTGVGIGKRII